MKVFRTLTVLKNEKIMVVSQCDISEQKDKFASKFKFMIKMTNVAAIQGIFERKKS